MSPEDLGAWRKAERERLIAARMAMPIDEHRAASEAILASLLERFAPAELPLLGGYWPFRREFDCLPYLREAVAHGAGAALPVVIAKGQPLEFRPWTPETKMEAGVWNILHPAEGPAVEPGALIVPLVGFDAAGYRLGYGAGFYDRTLAAMSKTPLTIGVGFELNRMETILPQPHDIPLDWIVTEAGVFKPTR